MSFHDPASMGDPTRHHQNTPVSGTQNKLLGRLPQGELCALAALGRTVELRKNQRLMQTREPVGHVYFPHGGLIGLMASLPDGKAVQVASIGAEGALGICAGHGFKLAIAQAVVLIPGTALRVPAPLFASRAEQSKSLGGLVTLYSNAFITQLAEMVACNAFHDIQARLSRYLLQARDHIGSTTLPLTQEMLSEALGVRGTTITFVVGTLQSKGIISYLRGTIDICNEAALTMLACPCYHSVRCLTDDLFST